MSLRLKQPKSSRHRKRINFSLKLIYNTPRNTAGFFVTAISTALNVTGKIKIQKVEFRIIPRNPKPVTRKKKHPTPDI